MGNNMNILVTGGAGFIGSHVVRLLLDKGYGVTVLDALTEQVHGPQPETQSPLYQSIRDRVRFIHGSVTQRDDWTEALTDCQAIIHLAAETGTGQSMYEIDHYVQTNVQGTALMLDVLCHQPHTIKKVVVASSRAIYGEGQYHCDTCGTVYPTTRRDQDMQQGRFECTCPHCGQPVHMVPTQESCLIHPTSVYGITKHTQEELVMTACPALGIAPVALRYQNVYGAGQSLSNPYTGILSIFYTRLKNGNGLSIFEDGHETRDFVYIDDVARATVAAVEMPTADGYVFNIGTGVATDVLTVAHTLAHHAGDPNKIAVTGHYRLGDIRHNVADLSLARERLHYEPRISFEEGMARFTQWADQQDVQPDRYEQSIREMKEKGLYK